MIIRIKGTVNIHWQTPIAMELSLIIKINIYKNIIIKNHNLQQQQKKLNFKLGRKNW